MSTRAVPIKEMKTSGDNLESLSKNIRRQKLFRNIICILLCIMSILPFYILIINATRPSAAIQQGLSFLPGNQFFSNIAKLADKSAGVGTPVVKAMLNSLTISVPATIFTVYFSSMTAYGVYVYDFKLRRFAWSFILAIMMIPTQVSIIGFYKFMIQIGLNDSYLPLIIPAIAAPATVFFMRQYMKTALPLEIIDAARIDGSGEFYTFNTIAVPLMKPAIATQAIFAFIASWNNLYTPSIILSSSTKYTLPMFVQVLRSEQFRSDYGVIYVGLLLTVLPLFVVYFALSKYIIAGVALGGVKE
ncbi:carbohydrate ABC transporter permease [Konateibacter massiliensis]|uniref:carbohydrate ABC transporter permease n=1 Tax=Konateibacter massiliensis TaxID=2002841 RepID=UPI001F3F56BA|nr:carbohydrate ABC transporter permease [Konateibacter massiliensis]